jgi:hypothetical protein
MRSTVELNNRELALLIWASIALLWMLSRRDLRQALGGVLRAFIAPAILLWIGAFAIYVLGCLYLAQGVGLWEDKLTNEAVLWFFITGLVLFFGATRVAEQDDFFAPTAKKFLTLGILAEVFVNFVVMPLPIELILLPLLTALIVMSAFTEGKEEYAPARKLVEGVSGVIGLALFAYVTISLISDPGQVDLAYVWRVLALPIWLTLACLPFIYLLGLYIAYDKAFKRIKFLAKDKGSARRAKQRMLTRFHIRAALVGDFDGAWQKKLVCASSKDEAQDVLRDFMRGHKHPRDSAERQCPAC